MQNLDYTKMKGYILDFYFPFALIQMLRYLRNEAYNFFLHAKRIDDKVGRPIFPS
jgi:hypothetical protein